MKLIQFVASAWASAVEQLGPGGAVLVAVAVVLLLGVFIVSLVSIVAAAALRERDEPPLLPKYPPMSPARRLELRRMVDARIKREATGAVDERRRA